MFSSWNLVYAFYEWKNYVKNKILYLYQNFVGTCLSWIEYMHECQLLTWQIYANKGSCPLPCKRLNVPEFLNRTYWTMASVFGPLRWLQAYCQQPTYNKVTRCDYDSHSRLLAVGFSLGVLMLFETLGVSWGPAGQLSSNFVLHFFGKDYFFSRKHVSKHFGGVFFQMIFM